MSETARTRHDLRDVVELIAPAASCAFRVPGRIEVLGKHTDYAGGRSLLAAIDRGITVAATARVDDRVIIRSVRATAQGSERVAFRLRADSSELVSGWQSYPTTVARRLATNFPALTRGAEIRLESDLPEAAGLSSSSALVTATFLALATVNAIAELRAFREAIGDREALAAYLAAVESGRPFRDLPGERGVGTQGGAEDHVAILCARPDMLVQYAFDPVRYEMSVPVPSGYGFVIASSGVRAEKTGASRGGYNRAAELMCEAAKHWRRESGRVDSTLGAAVTADPGAGAARILDVIRNAGARRRGRPGTADELSPPASQLAARVEQFLEESFEIVPRTADALNRVDLDGFGALVDRSQALAEHALGNQVPETVALARSAREGGAVAASAFGAGFGGSVWALVAETVAPEFLDHWRAEYLRRFPQRGRDAEFFLTRATDPVSRLR